MFRCARILPTTGGPNHAQSGMVGEIRVRPAYSDSFIRFPGFPDLGACLEMRTGERGRNGPYPVTYFRASERGGLMGRAYPEFRVFGVMLRKEKHHGPTQEAGDP
ncbi:hypothetical protein GCM10023158_29470 [Gluconacetobacter tumulicola]